MTHMCAPSKAIPWGPSPTGKVSTGPHVGGLLGLQGGRTRLQTPAGRDARGARGARQSFTAGGQVLHGPIVQSLFCAQLWATHLPLPSQTSPAPHAVPAGAGAMAQQPATHVGTKQATVGG